jgi:hypothetical protein
MGGQECGIKTIEADGKVYARLPYPPTDDPGDYYQPNCRDCGTPKGGVHHAFCCLDFCPVDPSHGQTLTCGHGIQDV